MKKTQIIETIQTIKGSLISYFSITVFVMLGIAIFIGMSWASSSLDQNAKEIAVNDGHLHDLQIFFPYGLSDEDLKKLTEVDGIDEIEGSKFSYAFFRTADSVCQTIIHKLPGNIDRFIYINGSLPVKDGEIAVDRKWAESHNIKIGDFITFSHDDDGSAKSLYTLINYNNNLDEISDLAGDADEEPMDMAYLNRDTFLVTALVTSPDYTYYTYGASPASGISLDTNMFVHDDAWAKDSDIGYTDIRICSNELRKYDIFSDEYDAQADELIGRIYDKLQVITTVRNELLNNNIDNILTQTDDKLKDAENKLKQASTDFKSGQIKLDDAKIQIENARKKIEEGSVVLDEAYATLIKNQDVINKGTSELEKAHKELLEKQKLFDENEAALTIYEEDFASVQTFLIYLDELITGFDENIIPDAYDDFVNIITNAKIMIDSGLSDIDAKQNVYDYLKSSDLGDKYAIIKDEFEICKMQLESFCEYPIPTEPGEEFQFTIIIDDEAVPITITATEDNIKYFISTKETLTAILDKMDQIEAEMFMIELLLQFTTIEDVVNLDEVINAVNEIYRYINTAGNAIHDLLPGSITELKDLYTDIEAYVNSTLNNLQSILAEMRKQLEDAEKELTNAWNIYNSKIEELENGKNVLKDGFAEYYRSIDELERSKAELEKAEKELLLNESKYKDALKDYNNGLSEYDDGKLSRDELAEKLATINNYDATIIKSNTNMSLLVFHTASNLCNKIKYIVALLFVIVGILVCYSAVSRLVHDHMISIGTKKALGLSRKEITLSFISYTMSAALIGCILSLILGRIIARIILSALIKDSFPQSMNIKMQGGILFIMWAIELILILATTYFSCRRVLKTKALKLLQGPIPIEGRKRFFENWKLWKKLPLLTKTIINNALNDKRRLYGTLIGITGCTTLMVVALTVSTNIRTGYRIQSKDFYNFNTFVYFDSTDENAADNVKEVLDKYDLPKMKSWIGSGMVDVPDNFFRGKIIVPSDMNEYKKFSIMKPYADTKDDIYSGNVYMCSAFDTQVMKKNGHDFIFTSTTGDKYPFSASGSYYNYSCSGESVMSPEKYEEVFGKPWQANCYILNIDNDTLKQLNNDLFETDGYLYTENFFATMNGNYQTLTSLTTSIVAIALILSIIMAFLVILNLLTMFVNEKKNELIVLRINGYTVKDAKRYIYMDTVLFTAISIIIGLLIGTLIGNCVLKQLESPTIMLYHGISPIACLTGLIGTSLLVFIASMISLKDIKKFKLTDIAK